MAVWSANCAPATAMFGSPKSNTNAHKMISAYGAETRTSSDEPSGPALLTTNVPFSWLVDTGCESLWLP